jgi:hypothetical protein
MKRFDDDEIFMTRFENTLNLEPAPDWANPKKAEAPWLEVAWAFAAALMLSLYWNELRFGLAVVCAQVNAICVSLPLPWLVVVVAGIYAVWVFLAPRSLSE